MSGSLELSPARRALLDALLGEREAPPADRPVPRRGGGDAPLSFAQERLWFLDRFEPGSPVYNILGTLHVTVPDVGAFTRALREVVRRHESLRTTFADRAGRPVQVVAPSLRVEVPVEDLSHLSPAERAAAVERETALEARRPFDLERGPLVRARLLRLEGVSCVLLVSMHHIVSDGWSMGVFYRELDAVHRAFLQGEAPRLAELPLQYADFACWQREYLSGARLTALLEYWRGRLAGAPPFLDLPTDRPRPATQSFRGGSVFFRVPAEVAGRVHALARAEGATPFMVLLAAFGALLSRYGAGDDVLVGSPIAGRTHSELEGLIGLFVNTLVLRVELAGDPAFRTLVRRVKETTLGGYAHQELPFERLVEALQPERSLSHNPLFQVMFILQNTPETLAAVGGEDGVPDDGVVELPGGTGTSKFDLMLVISEDGRGLVGGIEYAADLFDAATVRRTAEHFRRLLAAAVAAPDEPVAALPLLAEEERAWVTEASAGPPAPAGTTPAHRLAAEQARRTPDAPAVVWAGGTLTYAELDARAGRLARRLRALGVGPGTPVGVSLERSPELAVALLGVLKAGGAYTPLDPGYPPERLAFLVSDSAAPVLVTRRALAERLPAAAARVLVDEEPGDGEPEDGGGGGPLQDGVGPESLAYVIYTSGSTGRPKGVALPHRVLANLVAWQAAQGSGPWRTAYFASPSFDVSLQEALSTWAAGGALVIVSDEARRDPAELLAQLAAFGVERLFLPPFVLQLLAQEAARPGAPPLALREVITAGERLQVTPAVASFAAEHGIALRNQYGPSETHVVTEHVLTGPPAEWPALPPIGRPLPATRAWVLDGRGRPVPAGVPGELCLGGAGVARGYLGRPALTAARFVPDPHAGEPGARMYRTGDRARWRLDGTLEFLGRVDDQVKVRGFRVEPGEVEAALAAHPDVRDAVVAVRGEGAARTLVGYVVAAGLVPPSPAALRAFLAERLPEYMVPAAWVVLDALPLSPNGKVDRRALPVPVQTARASAAAFLAPRTPVEARLAGIWAEVLKVERVGVDDDFFELGGHSLLATQVVSRIRDAFGATLPLRKVFENPTVARLAVAVVQARAASMDPERLARALERIRGLPPAEAAARPTEGSPPG